MNQNVVGEIDEIVQKILLLVRITYWNQKARSAQTTELQQAILMRLSARIFDRSYLTYFCYE